MENRLVKEVTRTVRRRMPLNGVVRQLLSIASEQDTVHMAIRPFADQRNLLIHLCKFRTYGCNGPLDVCILVHTGSFVSEVPSIASPILESHITQVRSGTNHQLETTAMETAGLWCCTAGFIKNSCFRTFIQHDQRMRQVNAAIAHRCVDMQRLVDDDVLWHIEEIAICPHCSLQSRKPIGVDIDLSVQMLFYKLGMVPNASTERAEHDSLGSVFRI